MNALYSPHPNPLGGTRGIASRCFVYGLELTILFTQWVYVTRIA